MSVRRLVPVSLAVVVMLGVAAAIGMAAETKFGVILLLPRQAHRDQPVTVRIQAAEKLPTSCQMRLVAIAPGIDREEALDAFINGGFTVLGPSGPSFHRLRASSRLGFLMHPHRSTASTWTATAMFPQRGRWQVVVPNWCAEGYASPLPAVHTVTVQ